MSGVIGYEPEQLAFEYEYNSRIIEADPIYRKDDVIKFSIKTNEQKMRKKTIENVMSRLVIRSKAFVNASSVSLEELLTSDNVSVREFAIKHSERNQS